MTLVANCKDVAALEKGLELLGRKRRQKKLVQVKVEMGDEKIVRSKAVKCLGVMLDDELKWKEQVQNVRRKCFTGLAKMRLKNMLPSTTKKAVIQRPGTTPHGLLLGCMAGVLKRVEAEVRESAELWYEIDFVTTIPVKR